MAVIQTTCACGHAEIITDTVATQRTGIWSALKRVFGYQPPTSKSACWACTHKPIPRAAPPAKGVQETLAIINNSQDQYSVSALNIVQHVSSSVALSVTPDLIPQADATHEREAAQVAAEIADVDAYWAREHERHSKGGLEKILGSMPSSSRYGPKFRCLLCTEVWKATIVPEYKADMTIYDKTALDLDDWSLDIDERHFPKKSDWDGIQYTYCAPPQSPPQTPPPEEIEQPLFLMVRPKVKQSRPSRIFTLFNSDPYDNTDISIPPQELRDRLEQLLRNRTPPITPRKPSPLAAISEKSLLWEADSESEEIMLGKQAEEVVFAAIVPLPDHEQSPKPTEPQYIPLPRSPGNKKLANGLVRLRNPNLGIRGGHFESESDSIWGGDEGEVWEEWEEVEEEDEEAEEEEIECEEEQEWEEEEWEKEEEEEEGKEEEEEVEEEEKEEEEKEEEDEEEKREEEREDKKEDDDEKEEEDKKEEENKKEEEEQGEGREDWDEWDEQEDEEWEDHDEEEDWEDLEEEESPLTTCQARTQKEAQKTWVEGVCFVFRGNVIQLDDVSNVETNWLDPHSSKGQSALSTIRQYLQLPASASTAEILRAGGAKISGDISGNHIRVPKNVAPEISIRASEATVRKRKDFVVCVNRIAWSNEDDETLPARPLVRREMASTNDEFWPQLRVVKTPPTATEKFENRVSSPSSLRTEIVLGDRPFLSWLLGFGY